MKARTLFLFSLMLPFSMIFLYVYLTAADVPFRDDIYLIKGGFVENYCNGSLTFSDLWRPSASTRMPGYNLLQLVNILWFGMNSRVIVLLIPFLMMGSALLIYQTYCKSLLPHRSPEFIAATFIFLCLLIFNLIQWEGFTFSYGFVFQSPMPFLIASFASIETFLFKRERLYQAGAFIFPLLGILVFGGTHSFSFAPALAFTFLCFVMTRQPELTNSFWKRFVVMAVYLAALAYIYLHNIHYNDYFPTASHHIEKVLLQPLDALGFLLAAFGASVVGVNAADTYFPFQSMIAIGFCIVLTYGLGVVLFIRSKMYEHTYMPFYLLMHSSFYLVFMTLGRFGYGMEYGMASRYTCVSVYGLVGLIWIMIYARSVPKSTNPLWRIPLYASAIGIFAGLLLTTIVEWRIQPYRRAYFLNLHEIALLVDTASDEALSKFEERPKLVRQSLMVLKDCRLNVYSIPGGSRD
jgi:hypothetical protein